MTRLRRLTVAAALTCSAGLTPGAQAVEGNAGTTTRSVRAVLEARRTQVRRERYCTGADGIYRLAHETYEGTSTGDEDVTGRFVLEVRAYDNVTQGYQGVATGTVRIYDFATGSLKVIADVSAVDSPSVDPPGVKVDGFVSGRILGPRVASKEGGRGVKVLFANFSVLLDTTAAFVGNLGVDAPIPAQNTAVVQDGAAGCGPVAED